MIIRNRFDSQPGKNRMCLNCIRINGIQTGKLFFLPLGHATPVRFLLFADQITPDPPQNASSPPRVRDDTPSGGDRMHGK